MTKKVYVIGSGFAGLAAASVLAKAGMQVTVFEKNKQIGGRARTLETNGYFFDMGPSWYWMPDVFEDYFRLFDKMPSDFYDLKLLDPGFAIFFGKDDVMEVPATLEGIYALFDKEETNGADKLKKFLAEAELKYRLSMSELVYLPSESITEYMSAEVIKNAAHLHIFKSFHTHVRKYFKSPRLLKLMEFPVLFLGGSPRNIPALYSLMNYASIQLGTWYPMGGFSQITDAMAKVATDLGVEIRTDETVLKIHIENKKIKVVTTSQGNYTCDAIIGAADYNHTESLLNEAHSNYSDKYWDKKVMSPSCLIFYVGVNKKIKNLRHHNLFFDESLDVHTDEIYKNPQWPSKPLFYVCCTSKTDSSTAPEGHENVFILIPLAAGLQDNEVTREKYFDIVMNRLEYMMGEKIEEHIDYKKSYCINDFKADYNSYKGNAYGLANTLKQTAFMRPAIRNKKVDNLYYCGHLTVPGPGVPPALISGQIAANELLKKFKN
jgi:phytoene desaturase